MSSQQTSFPWKCDGRFRFFIIWKYHPAAVDSDQHDRRVVVTTNEENDKRSNY
ncbi:hypothetical protein HMPREF9141_1992 [Prevotella multiformis DSM 16608]|uniref:Uncharacterized protein n=1 Tax=Prevotella multiformis DSM 16608 TaxID=888743 RepID=F0F8S5_9BACT|nr:hypothetical protein HMPREF9141_1992 [Prevotella multiformis DSM 16608]